MKWLGDRKSPNVEDRRGITGGHVGAGGGDAYCKNPSLPGPSWSGRPPAHPAMGGSSWSALGRLAGAVYSSSYTVVLCQI